MLLQDYTPACVIINEQNEIVYFFGRTGKYLEPSQGAPSHNLFDLARLGLRIDLRAVIQTARQTQREATCERVSIEYEGQIITVNLIACPVKEETDNSSLLMVIFQNVGEPTTYETARAAGYQPEQESPVIKHLEDELRVTKEHLRATIEESESFNEELQSANEELRSANEEMQTSNEELQTSKEELQSINEELETVNSELRSKVKELDAANSDIQNLFESTRIATVFLDENLGINRFTPTATELFNLIGSDVGRPITDISLALEGVDIAADVQAVLRSLIPIEREVQARDKSLYYNMRIMPYRTLENVISGTVLTFVDVTGLRQAKNRAELWAQRQSAIAEIGTYALQDNDATAVCERAVDILCQTLKANACGLFVYRAECPAELLLQNGNGWPSGCLGQATVSTADSHPGYTLSVQQPVRVEDFAQEQRFGQSALLQDLDLVSGISAIIHGSEGAYGVLTSYGNQVGQFTPEDTYFLQAIANALAATLQREKTTQALVKSRESLDLAIDAGDMGIWDMDISTRQTTWNAIEYSLLGLTPEEIAEPSAELFYRYVHPDDILPVQEEIEAAIAQKTEFEAEFRISRDGYPERWLAAKARVITDAEGNAVKMIGVNYDITKRKQNEEDLKATDRRKDDFLAALGHELRNPLNALSNSITLMQTLEAENFTETAARDSSHEQLHQRAGQLHAVASRQITQLTRLVDDLLDFSRVAYQKIQLHRQQMDLTQLLRDLVTDAESAVSEKRLTLDAVLPEAVIWIDGDAARLMQAFSNVLQNAIKFTDPDGHIEISAQVESEHVTTRMTDTGIGMEVEALTRIFTAFTQEDRSLARSGGLGLGLPLAKGIIEFHEGQIWAESAGIGQGTAVMIRLPQLIGATEVLPPPSDTVCAPSVAAIGAKHILIIEDNEDSAFLLQIFLEDWGYQIDIANNGEQGLSLARQLQPDIIISDIGLTAAMDGYAVARAIRSDAALNTVCLIATSGYGQLEDKAKASAAGFDEHFTKPVNFDQLKNLIEQYMSLNQSNT